MEGNQNSYSIGGKTTVSIGSLFQVGSSNILLDLFDGSLFLSNHLCCCRFCWLNLNQHPRTQQGTQLRPQWMWGLLDGRPAEAAGDGSPLALWCGRLTGFVLFILATCVVVLEPNQYGILAAKKVLKPQEIGYTPFKYTYKYTLYHPFTFLALSVLPHQEKHFFNLVFKSKYYTIIGVWSDMLQLASLCNCWREKGCGKEQS